MGIINRVERGLDRAVNSAFAKAFKSEVQPVELASAIRRAMDDRAAVMGHGRTMVPNLYTIELSGTDFERLSGYEEALSDELVAAAQEHADSQRYQPGGPVEVSFVDDEASRPVCSGSARHRERPARSPPARRRPNARRPGRRRRARRRPAQRRPPSNPLARPWLVIDGERYPLIGAHTVIGRDELADVVLDDPGISRRHCEVRVTNDGPHLVTSIRDLGSTNGTFVNGERITSPGSTRGTRSPSGAPTRCSGPVSGDPGRVSEPDLVTTLIILRLGLLALLWVFVFSLAGVLRRDLYGTRIPARPARPLAPTPPSPARAPGPRGPGRRSGQPPPVPQPRASTQRRRREPVSLVVTEGQMTGTSLPLGRHGVLIGRGPECTLVLDDEFASGRHARISPRAEGWFVEDQGSRNGTHGRRRQITGAVPVEIGSVIRIGQTTLELRG